MRDARDRGGSRAGGDPASGRVRKESPADDFARPLHVRAWAFGRMSEASTRAATGGRLLARSTPHHAAAREILKLLADEREAM